jgi:hypothetical protein
MTIDRPVPTQTGDRTLLAFAGTGAVRHRRLLAA